MAWKNDQVNERETARILGLAQECLTNVEGDFTEFGCYRGDTSLLLADIIRNSSRKLWLYDSFEGLPKKRKEDESVLGENFKEKELFVTKREVKERFLRAGIPVPIIKKAWFCDLREDDLPDKIAFSFIDGDFYESIRDALRLVEPKMSNGGVIVVHDYSNPALPGVKKAVDEWTKSKNDYRVILL